MSQHRVLPETPVGPVQAHTSEQLAVNSNRDCVFCSTEMTGLGSRLELTGALGGRSTVAAAQPLQPGCWRDPGIIARQSGRFGQVTELALILYSTSVRR